MAVRPHGIFGPFDHTCSEILAKARQGKMKFVIGYDLFRCRIIPCILSHSPASLIVVFFIQPAAVGNMIAMERTL